MSYEKQTFLDEIIDENGDIVQEGTVLKAENLEHIEDGIVALDEKINGNDKPTYEEVPFLQVYEKGYNYVVTSNGRLFVSNNEYINTYVYQVFAGKKYRFNGESIVGCDYSYVLAQSVYDRPSSGFNTGAIYTFIHSETEVGVVHEYEVVPESDGYLYVQLIPEYEPFMFEVIDNLGDSFGASYTVADDGNGIEISYPYGNNTLTVVLNKRGGNNLFDFRKISTKTETLFDASLSDWHSPFVVAAVENINGDTPNNQYFTGGNHQTNNNSSGGAVTARTSMLQFYADGRLVTFGKSGNASKIEMRWTNMVQGYNTSKADGSGREILQENHILTFVNGKFEASVELIALENVVMKTYYGLQGIITNAWPKTRYIGGTNRAEYTGASESGDMTTYCMECYSNKHKMRIEIDPLLDLGRRADAFASGTKGAFSTDYGKCYFTVINKEISMMENDAYHLRGAYTFLSY